MPWDFAHFEQKILRMSLQDFGIISPSYDTELEKEGGDFGLRKKQIVRFWKKKNQDCFNS